MPARGDLRPGELTYPDRAVDGKLGRLRRIGQQIDGRVDPRLLRSFVRDLEMETGLVRCTRALGRKLRRN